MSYDPVYAKQQMNEPVSSNSTPVAAYSVSAAPTIAAAPVTAQPGYYPHQNTPNRQAYSVRPPPGHWGDNICDWPKNLFPSCWCTCCCCYGMWLSAQIGQKVGYSSFQCPVWTYVVIWIVGFIVTLATGSALFVVLMPMFFAFFFAIGLRIHLANRDNIQDFGGCFGEFCCGFWCWYCSVTQMARHVYGYTKVLDGDGDPDRPDNYAPINQV